MYTATLLVTLSRLHGSAGYLNSSDGHSQMLKKAWGDVAIACIVNYHVPR